MPHSRTASLRRQHDAALAIVAEIVALTERMGPAPDRADAYAATLLLARLTGTLRIHFAQEDRMLYPALMASSHGDTATVARRFAEEMGQIGPAFAAFAERWSRIDALLADPAGFRRESQAIFAALGRRVARENEELYPLAEALHAAETAAEIGPARAA